MKIVLQKIAQNQCVFITTIFFIFAHIVFTLPALFQEQHFLKNLEPYPDSLIYPLTAQNFATHGSLSLQYQGSQLDFWVPPLYSYFLSVGYFLTSHPEAFFAMNVLLGAATLGTLMFLMWQTSRSFPAVLLTGSSYLLHAYVVWLPSVAMAENLSLLLFIVALAALTIPQKLSWKVLIVFSFATLGLVLTKYATVILAAALVALFLLRFRRHISKIAVSIGIAIAVLSFFIFSLLDSNPFELFSFFLSGLISGTSPFYSLEYILPNLGAYLRALTDEPGRFLWLTTPLSSVFVFLLFLTSLVWHWTDHQQDNRWRTILLTTLFLAQFPLMLVFYVADARYIIFSIPLFAIGLGWLVAQVWESKYLAHFALSFLILLGGHIGTQLPLFKEVVSANILGRTTGWQYEAIMHFDQVLPDADEESFLITALPPFLVDAYTTSNYRVLPLSKHQEFLAKGQWVWGSDVAPETDVVDLFALYTNLIRQGKTVYISNAYITHLKEVTVDYEKLKEQFEFELVSEGCLNSCDLYRVTLPN